jgi:hypothetical protein
MVDGLDRHSTSPAAAGVMGVEYSPSVRRPSPIIVDINPIHSVVLFRKMRTYPVHPYLSAALKCAAMIAR